MKLASYPGKILLGLGVLLILLLLTDILLGSVRIPFQDVFSILIGNNPDSARADIVWQFRLPKAVTCVLAGASLASSGLMMQTLFRNPLAGPDVLGLSSGASLLVAIVILV